MKSILAYIRFCIFAAATFSLYGLWFIFDLVIPNKQFWRQFVFHKWSRAFRFVLGMKVEVVGNVPKRPFFLVTNHVSYVDIPLLNLVTGGIFVAKKEIDNWPVAGSLVRNMGAIFIDRTNRRDIPRAGDDILKALDNNEGVIVFPEGVSAKGDEVKPFHSSFFEFASQANLDVSYAALMYETPEGGPTATEVVCWWQDISFVSHLLRLLRLGGFTAVVKFGDEPVHNAARKVLAKELHDKVEELFVPMK
jgi:1-acyl-sn-glycerol-3-phosphate acyltransferase